jgi:hypothetical protein
MDLPNAQWPTALILAEDVKDGVKERTFRVSDSRPVFDFTHVNFVGNSDMSEFAV